MEDIRSYGFRFCLYALQKINNPGIKAMMEKSTFYLVIQRGDVMGWKHPYNRRLEVRS
jgi:hypothetical protein